MGTSLPASLQLGEERNRWCKDKAIFKPKLGLELNPQTQEDVSEPSFATFLSVRIHKGNAGSSSYFSHLIK